MRESTQPLVSYHMAFIDKLLFEETDDVIDFDQIAEQEEFEFDLDLDNV